MTNDTLKMVEALKAQLSAIEAQLQQSKAESSAEASGLAILEALKKHGGHATVAQLMSELSLTKGTALRYIWALEERGEVWIQAKRTEKKREGFVIHHKDYIAA